MARSINNWMELANLVEEHRDGSWLYRGESTDHEELKPKAGRIGSRRGAARKQPYDPAHEREALRIFKREARPHLGHRPETDLEWMAIAQHHGMSTRLLDWSESLLVAAFFAVFDAGTRGNGVIYAVENVPTATEAMEREPFQIKSVRLYRPPHISPRIPAQRSVFTYHPSPTEDFRSKKVVKYEIDKGQCGRIKNLLDRCAINESSLFPDIDGLSRYLGWRYKWAKFHEGDGNDI